MLVTRVAFLCLIIIFGAAPPIFAEPLALYVAPDGDDGASGRSPDEAFATPQRACDELRALGEAGERAAGATVHIAGGTYERDETLVLGAEHSGSADAPVVLRGDPDDPPVLTGARRVEGLQPYEGRILRAPLSGTPLEGAQVREVTFGGEPLTLARYPNVEPDDPHFGTWAHVLDVDGDGVRDRFICTEDVIKEGWTRVDQARVCIHPGYDWAWNILPVAEADPESGEIALARDASYDLRVGDRLYVENLLEELDAPGEWYFDAEASMLYVMPPGDVEGAEVRAAVTDTVLRLEGASHVTVEGLVIEGCTDDAVRMEDCEECTIARSVVRSCRGWGIVITGGHGSGAFGNDICDTGEGGISLSGGDRETLERGENFAENNYIHHIARVWRTYRTGVNCRGVGNRVAHNLIHDTYHAGMTLGGNENVVELNEVHHTNLGSADTGGIYFCSRDWTQRGNIIRHNIFHHLGGFGKANSWSPVRDGKVTFEYPHFTWGIYLDDPTTGTQVYGNVLHHVPICGLHNHGGRDNSFVNNIIVDAPAFGAGALSPSWSEWPRIRERLHDHVYEGSPYLELYPELAGYTDENPQEMSGLTIERNIVYYTGNAPAWLDPAHYRTDGAPQVFTVRCAEEDWAQISFDHNLIHAPEGMEPVFSRQFSGGQREVMTWEQWRATGADEHSRMADPMFVDAAGGDFHLRDGSPALEMGFEPIPLERIGPYEHELRASWPIVEAPGAARLGEFHTERHFQLPGYEPVPARATAARGGLPNALAKLEAGEAVRIAYFGGGIHPTGGWRAQVLEGLSERYPEAEITEIDAAICDCVRGINFSVFRFRHDVLAHDPDLVLVDFISGDHGRDMLALMEAVEGIVRQAWQADPAVDLLFLHAYRPEQQAAYDRGLAPSEVSAYERVAEHYAVPSISPGYHIAELVREGAMRARPAPEAGGDVPVFSTDGRRPSDAAREVYAQAIVDGLAEIAGVEPQPRTVPEPLREDNLEDARLVEITPDMLEGEWERTEPEVDGRSFARQFDDLWVTREPGARLTFRFRGTHASTFNLIGPDHGRMKVTVDGEDAGVHGRVDRWCHYHRLSATTLASGVNDAEHTVTIELMAEPPNRQVAIEAAREAGTYDPEDFEGVALHLGWLRIVGETLQ